jgi:hypothetical protein
MITDASTSIYYPFLALCENSEFFCRTGLAAARVSMDGGSKSRGGKGLRRSMRDGKKYFPGIKNSSRITRVIKIGLGAFLGGGAAGSFATTRPCGGGANV